MKAPSKPSFPPSRDFLDSPLGSIETKASKQRTAAWEAGRGDMGAGNLEQHSAELARMVSFYGRGIMFWPAVLLAAVGVTICGAFGFMLWEGGARLALLPLGIAAVALLWMPYSEFRS